MTPSTVYPLDLVDEVTLPGDRVLRVRPLRRCEDGPVRELYSRLSPATRYLRFFSPMPVLPDSVLHLLTGVDYCRRLTLLAEFPMREGANVVALGNFGVMDDGRAEIGLVVRDEWQRQGIGTIVAARLLRAAEARGFHRFVAHALSHNRPIRSLLRRVGDIVATRTRHGVTEISFVARASVRSE
jgi:RimJ/RimL family protein N-acetyltransferase